MHDNSKLAVLIPTYNGGDLLRESLSSCAGAGLDPARYEILVVDNCSTDGSTENLPISDKAGAPIRLVCNTRNEGRVENWNRALDAAMDGGYKWAAFLFVGDSWLPGGSLPALLETMEKASAVMGLAPVQITANDGTILRTGKRVAIESRQLTVEARTLLEKSIRSGHVPFAPIQANVYRLHADRPLRFDPANPLSTDIEATIELLQNHSGPVVVHSLPFLAWKLHEKRFYASQDAIDFMRVNVGVLERSSSSTGIPVDWTRANTILFLNGIWGRLCVPMPFKNRVQLLIETARFIKSRPGHVSPFIMMSLLANKVFYKRSYIALP